MMSLQQIVRLNAQIAREARQQRREPLHYFGGGLAEVRHIPNLGSYGLSDAALDAMLEHPVSKGVYAAGDRRPRGPKGYRCERVLFVDKTGVGEDSEPALSVDQFLRELVKGRYYAMVQEGPFQAYVAEYVRGERSPA